MQRRRQKSWSSPHTSRPPPKGGKKSFCQRTTGKGRRTMSPREREEYERGKTRERQIRGGKLPGLISLSIEWGDWKQKHTRYSLKRVKRMGGQDLREKKGGKLHPQPFPEGEKKGKSQKTGNQFHYWSYNGERGREKRGPRRRSAKEKE